MLDTACKQVIVLAFNVFTVCWVLYVFASVVVLAC